MIWLLLLPIAILVFVRWLTRRTEADRVLMTDARRADLIRREQEGRP